MTNSGDRLDVTALLDSAKRALATRDWAQAKRFAQDAAALQPESAEPLIVQAIACRLAGEVADAFAILEKALTLEPRDYFARLSKASVAEQLYGAKTAARLYREAMQVAPDDAAMPAALRQQTDYARKLIAQDTAELVGFIREKVVSQVGASEIPFRFWEGLDIYVGLKRPYVQEALLLNYPQLPPTTFYDRKLFPWLEALEAQGPTIEAELVERLDALDRIAEPYVQFPPDAPANQWADLNHNRKWSAVHLWRDGARIAEACAQFPKTEAVLAGLPLAQQVGYAPTAMFSALAPRCAIPPHTGSSNTRLIVHLPLILPGPAWFRVGNETRYWRKGEAWVFDDTIEHEAFNESEQRRIILIFDVWNPHLSELERTLISVMMGAKNEFYASDRR